MAKKLGVSRKTILRDQELLRAISGGLGLWDKNYDTGGFRWWYSDRRCRVFSKWVATKGKRRRR